MGEEELPLQPDEGANERNLAAELAALSARVSALERQLGAMHGAPAASQPTDNVAEFPVEPVPGTSPAAVAEGVKPASPPPPPMPSFIPVGRHPQPGPSLESRLGAQVFNRIGIFVLLIGSALGLKLAVDNQLIGPVGRIVIGLIAGAGLIVWSERFRKKHFVAFSYSLKAIGTGVLYLSLWAAFQLYHLLPAEAALGGMILVTVWNAYMAWVQDSELLAVYALAGAFATPVLLSTGGNHEVFLFTYLLAIDIATVALVRLKPWARLLLGSFAATVIYFIGWFVQFFAASELGVTASFVVLFFLVFVGIPLRRAAEAKRNGLNYVTTEILLPWWNAAFVSVALYSVLQDSGHHAWLPWLMLVLAAFYLALIRLPQTEVAAAMHLSIAVVFLTIAIPLKASGHWITVAWLVEGLALAWVATRISQTSTSPSRVLRFLSAGAFVLGLCGVISREFWFENTAHPLLNSDFSAALVAIAALGAAAWLAFRVRAAAPDIWLRFTTACLVAVELVALLLCLREIVTSRSTFYEHEAFANADFAMAIVGIAVIAAVAWVTYRISAIDTVRRVFWRQIAGISIIAINLISVLTGEREIQALWPNAAKAPEAQLQQALAVSAFLMIYGGLLLAVGFWKRSAFIRWQALLLIVFTIIKVFAYDTRNLSQGYRVVSFLGLGALLMVVSFAYQKDWLGLRESNAASTQSTGTSQ